MYKSIEEMKRECYEIGYKEGYEEGYEIGIKEVRKEVAHTLLKEGSLTLEEISQVTSLSLAEIKQLQASQTP